MAQVVTHSPDGTFWGYAGVQVSSALDLTRDREFADLTTDDRLARAVERQRAWLEAVLSPGVTVQLRYLRDPTTHPQGGFECFVLTRVATTSEESAREQLERITERLRPGPGHVEIVPLDEVGLLRAITPFLPGSGGRAEIWKRCDTGVPNRPDAGVDRYWAVAPLRSSSRSWATLYATLAHHRAPVALSIGLATTEHDTGLGAALDEVATYYGVLATETESEATGLYARVNKLHADAFAVDAQKVFSDVARRYRSRVHSMQVTIASPQTLDDGLLALIASTISPPDVPHEGMALNGPLASSTTETSIVGDDQATSFDDAFRSLGIRPRRLGQLAARFHAVARIAEVVDTREATSAFRLPIAETGRIAGFDVRSDNFDVAVAQRRTQSDRVLVLGPQIVNGVERAPITIELDDLTMHAFIVGTTGSGKTSTTLTLLDRLWQQWSIPWLVIEPVNTSGNDYRLFLDRPGFSDSVAFTAGDDEVAPLRINLFEFDDGVSVGEHLSTLLGIFDAAFGLWDPLPAIYRRALQQVYFEAGYSLTDRTCNGSWPTIREFADEMRLVTDGLDYAGEVRSNIIAASRVRVEQLTTGPLRSVFDSSRSTPLDLLLDRPCIVELGKVGAANEQEAAFVIAALLARIGEHRRAGAPSRLLRHVIVVEEAHKLLRAESRGGGEEAKGDSSAAAARMFADLLAEIRKYGQAIVVADQDPAKLVPDAYKNTNLKVMHRLPAESDRELVGGTMRFDDDHRDQAAALERFTAFVHAEGYDRPGLVRFANIREGVTTPLPDDAAVRARFESVVGWWGTTAGWLMPYRECSGCTAVCTARSWAHATASRRAVEQAFRELAVQRSTADEAAGDAIVTTMIQRALALADGHRVRARCLVLHLARAAYDRDVDRFLARVDRLWPMPQRGPDRIPESP